MLIENINRKELLKIHKCFFLSKNNFHTDMLKDLFCLKEYCHFFTSNFTRSHIYLFHLDCFFVEKQILQLCYLSHLIKSPPKKLMTRQKRRIFHWWKLFLQFWLLDKSCIPVILYQWEFFGELRYVMIWFVTLNRCYFVSNISYNTLRQSKHDNVTFMQC